MPPDDCPSCGEDAVSETTAQEDRTADRRRYLCGACGYEWTERSSSQESNRSGPQFRTG